MRELSNRNWELREQVYNLLHRWPAICGAVIIGAFIGWVISLIWPAHYRASEQIYLGFNAYRRYSDTIFEALANPKYSNLDNYQYWQMSQLDAAIFLDQFLNPSLEKLRQEDAYWQSIEINELQSMLSSEWRTTGTWSLIADHTNPKLASQAVKAWSSIAIDQIEKAVDASRGVILIDHKLRVGEAELLQAQLRSQDLISTLEALDEWSVSALKGNITIPPEPEARWNLLAVISSAADFSPPWTTLLELQPPEDAPINDFLMWTEETKKVIHFEIQDLDQRIIDLDNFIDEQSGQYALESEESLSLSPNIEIERMGDSSVRIVRPTTTFILMGAIIGLLVWLLYQLSLIPKYRRNQ